MWNGWRKFGRSWIETQQRHITSIEIRLITIYCVLLIITVPRSLSAAYVQCERERDSFTTSTRVKYVRTTIRVWLSSTLLFALTFDEPLDRRTGINNTENVQIITQRGAWYYTLLKFYSYQYFYIYFKTKLSQSVILSILKICNYNYKTRRVMRYGVWCTYYIILTRIFYFYIYFDICYSYIYIQYNTYI